ncbi:type II toxin-antitoxin system HigB family toxin [Microcoleus sp. herbarium19]|uniref:type II toxin-antitoxin system HigB family toxin n=1 Tax=unclassified Microcoleus TaxID=2642155 RepID=UPI002FD357A8
MSDSEPYASLHPTPDYRSRVGFRDLNPTYILGNKVRLIAAIHYNRKKVYIRAVLTHSEYDEERWKK